MAGRALRISVFLNILGGVDPKEIFQWLKEPLFIYLYRIRKNYCRLWQLCSLWQNLWTALTEPRMKITTAYDPFDQTDFVSSNKYNVNLLQT